MAKILVTGGAGFIGSHIVDAYVAAGHAVVVLDDLSTGTREHLNPAAGFFQVDVRSPEVGEILAAEQPDFVNHLAAQADVRRSVSDPIFDADVNILGGINLLEQSARHGAKKFLFASTGGAIYGEPAELPASEACPPDPKSHYAASKLAFEHYIKLYQKLYGLPYTILRFPNVYGPRQNPQGEAGVCAILIGLMLEGKETTLFGHGEPTRDYVYVEDIARANVAALESGENAIINLGSGTGTTVRAVFDALAALLRYQQAPRLEPLRPGEATDSYITSARARELLGWEPQVTLEEGLRRTVAYIVDSMAGRSAR